MFQDQILWNAFFSQASKITKSWKNIKIKNDKILWFWLTFVVFLSPTIFKNTKKKKLHVYCRYPETCCFILLINDSAQERWNQYWCLEMILWGGESKREKTTLILKSSPDFVVSCSRFLLQQPKGIKDGFILKSSQISFFLLQESKTDKKNYIYFEKFPDFVVFFSVGVKERD